jgi:hypothetical protein
MAKKTTRSNAEPASAAPVRATKPRTRTTAPRTRSNKKVTAADPLPTLSSVEIMLAQTVFEPSEDDIRVRAYHRYLERAGNGGSDFDDWVEARRDLLAGR